LGRPFDALFNAATASRIAEKRTNCMTSFADLGMAHHSRLVD
jgi:hypothetical protein